MFLRGPSPKPRPSEAIGRSRLGLLLVPLVATTLFRADAVVVQPFLVKGPAFTRPFFPVGFTPAMTLAANLNGDSHVDLLVVNKGKAGQNGGPASLSLLYGAGDGTFQQASVTLANTGFPSGAVVGDVNGDHRNDIVIYNAGVLPPGVLLADDHGGFAAPISLDVPGGAVGLARTGSCSPARFSRPRSDRPPSSPPISTKTAGSISPWPPPVRFRAPGVLPSSET
jgi:hypothetical protein